eukprot:m.291580 g.291580  ORF g.291580 m.291580 type:complete len:806 (+) comp16230_c0_seq2:132-2549(+)
MEKASTVRCVIAAFAVTSCGIATGDSPHKLGHSTNLVSVNNTEDSADPKVSSTDADTTVSPQIGMELTHEVTPANILKVRPPAFNLTSNCSNVSICHSDAPCNQCLNVLMAASGEVPIAEQPNSVLNKWASRNISVFMTSNVCDLNVSSGRVLNGAISVLNSSAFECGYGLGISECGLHLSHCHNSSQCRHCVGNLYNSSINRLIALSSPSCRSNTTMPVLQAMAHGCDGFPSCTFHKVSCNQLNQCRECANMLKEGDGAGAAEHCANGTDVAMLTNVVTSCMTRTSTACDYAEARCRADSACRQCFDAMHLASSSDGRIDNGHLLDTCTRLSTNSQNLLIQITDVCPLAGASQCRYAVASCALSPVCVACYNHVNGTNPTQCGHILDQELFRTLCHQCDDSIRTNNALVMATAVIGGFSTAVCVYVTLSMIAVGLHRDALRHRVVILLIVANLLYSIANTMPIGMLSDVPGECGEFKYSYDLIRVGRSLWFAGKGMLVAVEIFIVWASRQAVVSKFNPATWVEGLFSTLCVLVGVGFFTGFYVECEKINKRGYNAATELQAENGGVNHISQTDDRDDDGLIALQNAQASFADGRHDYDELVQRTMWAWLGFLFIFFFALLLAVYQNCRRRKWSTELSVAISSASFDDADTKDLVRPLFAQIFRPLYRCVVVYVLFLAPAIIMVTPMCVSSSGGNATSLPIDPNDQNINQGYTHVNIGMCDVICECALSLRTIATVIALMLFEKERRRELCSPLSTFCNVGTRGMKIREPRSAVQTNQCHQAPIGSGPYEEDTIVPELYEDDVSD